MCRICMLSVVSAAGVLLMTLAGHPGTALPGGPPTQRAYGLEKRLPLTSSRVVGSGTAAVMANPPVGQSVNALGYRAHRLCR